MKQSRFLLAFGSETGQSRSIAHGMVDIAREQHEICADVYELDDVDTQFKLQDEPVMVIVTSSTGDGEPPSNASKFWRKIRREKNPTFLSHMKYTVLGLGDTNYSNFCNCGRVIDRRFSELGATRFYPSAWADDAVGLDKTVEPWLNGFWLAIKETLAQINNSSSTSAISISKALEEIHLADNVRSANETVIDSRNKFYSDQDSVTFSSTMATLTTLNLPPQPSPSLRVNLVEASSTCSLALNGNNEHRAILTNRKCLTDPTATKPIVSIELKLSDDEFLFEPGDSIKIACANDPDEVDCLLKRLSWCDQASHLVEISISPDNTKKSAKIPSYIPPMCSLRFALTYCLDIRSAPRKNLLRLFVDCTTDKDEKRRIEELCSREGSEDYIKYVVERHLSLLDIFNHFPSCSPSVAMLIEFLPSLMPRFYSICNSPLDDARCLNFVYSLLKFDCAEGRTYERHGVCTNWLNKIDIGSEVFIQTRASQHFRLPSTLDTPLIMIGPGTGVAPFIGFLEHLLLQSKSINDFDTNRLNTWLFYGCRDRQKDFLFQEQIEKYENLNILKHFYLAVSREENYPYRYVQDQIRANGEKLAELIYHQNAIIYVCGDIKVMVRDVRETIGNLLEKYCGLSNPEEFIKSLETSRRYLLDIWS